MPAQPNNTGLEYARYLHDYLPTQGWSGGGDAGFQQAAVTPMSEDEWNALPPAQRYSMLSNPQSAAPESVAHHTFQNDDNDEDTARFRARFGAEPYGSASGFDDEAHRGRTLWGYGPLPTMFDATADTWMIDPSRVLVDPDGRWHIEATNVKGDWLAQQNKNADRTWQRHVWQNVGHLALAAAGGAYGEYTGTTVAPGGGDESLGLAGTGTGPTVPVATGGDLPAGTEIPNSYTPGTTPSGAPTPTPAPGPEVSPPIETTPAPGPTPYPGEEVPPPTGSSLSPGTQAPAPVSNAAPATPSTGIINGARNAAQPVLDWYNNLSPAARMVVNQGLSTGSSAVLNGISQHNQQAAVEAADQRQRDDVIRRGQVQAFAPGAITAKPKPKSASASLVPVVPIPGIIDAVRSQG